MFNRLPPLNALKTFESAARHLSFTRAANELFVTQAAVSHQIKALETHLGLKLFQRRNRALRLTEEGQSYFLDLKEIFLSLGNATEKLLARTATGSLTVSLQPSFAIQWLVPRLVKFSEQHPEIDVRIKAVDEDEGSLREGVDLAIYYGRGHWPNLRCHKLHAEYLLPLCSPALLQGKKKLETLADLSQHTLLHDSSRKEWKTWMKQVGVNFPNVNQGPIFSHSSMVLQAAIHGQGIALGHNVLAKPELDAGRLVCPFSEVLVSKKCHYLVCEESQAELGKVAAFRDWMINLVEQEEKELDGIIETQ
ncbi:transcriptional regulator GcvA [Motilimonas sp. 1_MG-2023]|uniref:transcriptional regulator GcvA n=1 Tax=Motilimonas TaxID=1914248 RepID=UPI0026E18DAF|nr:transcriptional regulator GcvA [Motilimonas sp. 1_MG-2023]MDO6527816.1 transcriptional regulator GcvA [Motilimonas sp. 1_MG-2023]